MSVKKVDEEEEGGERLLSTSPVIWLKLLLVLIERQTKALTWTIDQGKARYCSRQSQERPSWFLIT